MAKGSFQMLGRILEYRSYSRISLDSRLRRNPAGTGRFRRLCR
jgi:hypothetical protein